MQSPWKLLLESPPAPQRAWRERLGACFEAARLFLLPTGAQASFVPCPRSAEAGCGWRVTKDAEGRFSGQCPDGRCEAVPLDPADLAMLHADRRGVAEALRSAFRLTGEAGRFDGEGVELGWVSPFQGVRIPAILIAPFRGASVFSCLQRFASRAGDRPFVAAFASRDALDTDCLGLLSTRGAEAVFLDEDLPFNNARRRASDVAARLNKFALRVSGVTEKHEPPRFPTPEGADWSDLTISEVDGHTIEIRARVSHRGGRADEAVERYSFEALGMAKESKRGRIPSTDWERFLLEVVRHRRVVATNPPAWDSLRTSKRQISKLLADLTGLNADGAFKPIPGRWCYEAGFKVLCSPADETPVPDRPRRLNQRGAVARGPKDE